MALDQITSKRLVKVLGMTGSTFDGEALVAIRKANDILKTSGITWEDVITTAPAPNSGSAGASSRPSGSRPGWQPGSWREPNGWRDAVSICRSLDGAPLSEWDREFLDSLSRRYYGLTEKQQFHLDRIVDACRRWHERRAA